jgi:hypothetical protein
MCKQKKVHFSKLSPGLDLSIDLTWQLSQLLEYWLHGTKLTVSVTNEGTIDTFHRPCAFRS